MARIGILIFLTLLYCLPNLTYIYNSKRDEMATDLYAFLVKLKTRMVIEEYQCNIYDKHVEIETMWARLADSVQF